MELRQTTQDLLDRVESVTGRPVLLVRDPRLTKLAAVAMARGSAPAHVVTLGIGRGAEPDYQISHQCGLILRHFARRRGDRWDFSEIPSGRSAVFELMQEPAAAAQRPKMAEAEVEALADKLFVALMTQLRSVPIGLRVDTWLREKYPDLRSDQKRAVLADSEREAAALDLRAQKMAPAIVSEANLAMGAAQAAFWAEVYDLPGISRPYNTAGHLDRGRALLAILAEVPDKAVNDRDLVDAWAAALGLTGWYAWVPFDDPA
jgi:hypothetical protein